LETQRDQPTPTVSKAWLSEQIKICLRSGDYARALDLSRNAAAEFPNDNDAELAELEKLARNGVNRNVEASRLITESQELFAQRKSAEAIQLLRQAHELDKKNALARAILANALVEHAQSVVDTDWLEAETLTNQALALNPAHPTAKTVHSLIVDRKTTSSVEDWVTRARKLQSSGDLFAALAWVAEGLAVHPDDPKLLQIHDAIQRDQGARRRQARRGDLEDLRRMQREIDGATDVAAKQALAVRIQTLAAKHWTDGEILSIANALLLCLGLSPESSSASPRSKGATVILHVPRPSAREASSETTRESPPTKTAPSRVPVSEVPEGPVPSNSVAPQNVPTASALEVSVPPSKVQPSKVPPSEVRQRNVPLSIAPVQLVSTTSSKPLIPAPQAATVSSAEPSAPAVKVTTPSQPIQPASSNSTTLIVFGAAIILVAATFFFTRKHYASSASQSTSSAPIASTPTASASDASAAAVSAAVPTTLEPSLPTSSASSDTSAEKVKSSFPDSPQPKVRIPMDKEHEAKIVLTPKSSLPAQNVQPPPRSPSLNIQGGVPGTSVFVDQTLLGTIQADGTLAISAVGPGDHSVELRKERFKPRQLQERFVAGATVSLVATDVALEAAPESALGELRITFAPADATVAIVKGDLLKMVSSGVPLNLSAGTYTLTARTAERFTRSSTLEVVAGQSRTLDLSLAPNGMAKWDDPGAWKHDGDSFARKGGDFVTYGVAPASGTFVFSAMSAKGHLLQWVLNYSDPKNYILFQMDDKAFYRTVIRHGEKSDEIIVPEKDDKKSFRTIQIRVSSTEIVHQIKHGDRWIVLDRWTQPGANLSGGKFGFYIPGNDQVAISSFAHYSELNIR
jgi:tetratricopeptide (TPR) repeat protein